MASIRKKNNSYEIRVSCGYDVNGKQRFQQMTWKPSEGMTEKQIEKEVQRQAVLFEEACLKGNVVTTIKFEDFARQWFSEYAEKRLKAQTIRGYHYLEPRIYKAIGHLRIDKITPRHVQKFINELSEENRRDSLGAKGQKLSAKTVKLHLSLISTVFDYAIKMQMIQTNPCKSVTLPHQTKRRGTFTPLKKPSTFWSFLNPRTRAILSTWFSLQWRCTLVFGATSFWVWNGTILIGTIIL